MSHPIAWIALLLGLPAPLSTLSASMPRPGAAVERDLALTIESPTPGELVLGHHRDLQLVLQNHSTTNLHTVAQAGPHTIRYVVDRRDRPDAPWRPAPYRSTWVCSGDPPDEAVTLEPGEGVKLRYFVWGWSWDVDGATDVRVVAHYVSDEGAPPLEIASAPLELRVVHAPVL